MSARWLRESKRANASQAAAAPEAAPRLTVPLGQGPALLASLRQARRLVLPHAILVSGAHGIGKTVVMKWLTAALLCPSDLADEGPCGVCRTCSRIAADLHPDVHVLQLARDEDDKEANKHLKKSFYVVSIEQVRYAQEALSRHAVEGRARVLRVDSADCMSDEAQNALLKTLEEPGQATFLLLEAASPERLLPTVHSRVQRLRVLPLEDSVVEREILRRSPTGSLDLPQAIGLCRGSLGLALELGTKRMVHLHDLVLQALDAPQGLRPIDLAGEVVEGIKERWLVQEQARSFLWLLRAEIRGRRDALAEQADDSYPASTSEPWTSWLELTLAADRDLDLQIPAEQVLAACLLQFSGD